MKNIILIGMPACGKSIIGSLLSNEIDFEFYDADKYLEESENREISDIFSEDGEDYFRELETKYLEELSKKEGVIISTGGGAVKKEKNMEIVKGNGIVIFLNRKLENIAKENHKNRPLLKNLDNLKKLYDERIKLYHKYSDIIIENDDDISVVVNRIVTTLKGKI
ncbi:shikimate kinase [Leptotrichia sp. oral taxon 847]|uniref:shikimate kinase n=1 Tax=Leptotrichia sp. oral taxon 847 TaxID=1785996 RepID=UPI000767E90F|nr:shikimate kinase [Leptotrichia sp. oral taxon 847]AMD95568.1 shikimate kinase [Leptotrichia sp. oral taxon 847]